jgi:hypothetical protein
MKDHLVNRQLLPPACRFVSVNSRQGARTLCTREPTGLEGSKQLLIPGNRVLCSSQLRLRSDCRNSQLEASILI